MTTINWRPHITSDPDVLSGKPIVKGTRLFLADENVPVASISLLRDAGHDVLAVAAEMRGSDDGEVLDRAIREERIILTFDRTEHRRSPSRGPRPAGSVGGGEFVSLKDAWRGSGRSMSRELGYPPGWDEVRVQRVLEHYQDQTDDEAVAEDEAAFESTTRTVMQVPVDLVPAVRKLPASRRTA